MNDIIRVFPRKTKWTPTDDLAFVGEPPLFRLPNLLVCISVTFSWDSQRAVQLMKAWRAAGYRVDIGGPLYPWIRPRWKRFYPGRFIKPGVTFTSRGCNKKCPWCRVWHYEGSLREINIAAGHIVQDNNLLACSRPHIEKVFDMLRQQKKAVKFSGGLDINYLQPWHIELLKTIKVDELWVACDRPQDLKRLDKAVDLLSDFPTKKKRCYILGGFNGGTIKEAENRCRIVYEKGFLPFAQIYQPYHLSCVPTPSRAWREWARKWCRPAIYRGQLSND